MAVEPRAAGTLVIKFSFSGSSAGVSATAGISVDAFSSFAAFSSVDAICSQRM